ncbi:MAG: MucR family transcriptional regulator [Terriglobia bacterium]
MTTPTKTSDEARAADPVLPLTAHIVMAFVRHNSVPVTDVPALLKSVYAVLRSLLNSIAPDSADAPKPAVPIRKSIASDHIVCLEDGKKLKMLKRYLRARFQLSPEEYRARWGLPLDYPMVAPDYAAQRSAFAKRIGLGRSRTQPKQRRRSA